MALTKDQKMKFVEQTAKELKNYKTVGVLPVNSIPDRLVQKSRNTMRDKVKFVIAKKSLLARILESDPKTKGLSAELTGMSAIVMSNEDPFTLYKGFKSNTLKLGAKPNQISPEDINIQAGETSLQPGQQVTELKLAGIDVQIQKGKVVIAKDKVLVKKGSAITSQVAKALKTLDIQPFSATIEPAVLLHGNIAFRKDVLGIDAIMVRGWVATSFASALAISMKAKLVNQYTIKPLISEAFRGAYAVALEGKVYEKEVIDRLLGIGQLQAMALNAMVKEEPAPAAPASAAAT